MATLASVQADTLDKFLEAWKNQTVEDTIALWSDDFKQRLRPFSLGTPLNSRDEAASVYPTLTKSLTNWELDIKDIVHDAARCKAAVYATSRADTPLPGETWTNEYAIFIYFTEDGTKVERLEEMVDSAFFQNYFPKFQKFLMEQGASN